MISRHTGIMKKNGRFDQKRKDQIGEWLKSAIVQSLENEFHNSPKIIKVIDRYRSEVLSGKLSPAAAVEELINLFRDDK